MGTGRGALNVLRRSIDRSPLPAAPCKLCVVHPQCPPGLRTVGANLDVTSYLVACHLTKVRMQTVSSVRNVQNVVLNALMTFLNAVLNVLMIILNVRLAVVEHF